MASSWPFHSAFWRQSNSLGVLITSCPFDKLFEFMTLHDCDNIVPGSDGIEQFTLFPFSEHLISNISDTIGGHFSSNTEEILNYKL